MSGYARFNSFNNSQHVVMIGHDGEKAKAPVFGACGLTCPSTAGSREKAEIRNNSVLGDR